MPIGNPMRNEAGRRSAAFFKAGAVPWLHDMEVLTSMPRCDFAWSRWVEQRLGTNA